jgi:membrane-bound metal-dependent hydrolase YbcI (DUF457 family)
MFIFDTLLPALLIGGLLIYFSKPLADFFESTGSTNLIRGLDNPWTFKILGGVIAIGYPLYALLEQAMLSSINQ